MKTTLNSILLCLLSTCISCMEFDSFERIEDEKLRVIGMQFNPAAEFAPGDTVTCTVHFAGNDVISISEFSVAYIHKYDRNDYFPDERKIAIVDSVLWLPDSAQFRYTVPHDVFLKEQWYGSADSTTVKAVVGLIGQDQRLNEAIVDALSADSLSQFLDILSSFYSRCHLFFKARSQNGTTLKIHGEFVIRYNSLYPNLLPVNNNPQIRWVGIYKVSNSIGKNFNPHNPSMKNKYTISYLYNEYYPEKVCDTIEIDTGFTYFLAGDEGKNVIVDFSGDTIVDTTIDFIENSDTKTVPEKYTYRWFYQNVDCPSIDPDSLLTLDNMDVWYSLTELKPPLFTDMSNFKIWLVVYDEGYTWNRPRGYAIRGVQGIFRYTDAYKRSVR